MSEYWSELVAKLDPYTPGEQPRDRKYIKLNTNENPYPPSPAVARALGDFDCADLARYPDPQSGALVDALARYHGLDNEQVFVGNGSDEVLAHLFQAFFRKPDPVLFPDISYSFYPVYCRLFEVEYRQPALDANFEIELRDYSTANGGIIIPNPNAPTGIALPPPALRELLADNPESVVAIDEAYVDFGAESALPLIEEFANLVVVRTFSKSRSLAGLRLGYALGQAHLIEALQRVKNSFNSYPVDSITSAAGIASLGDETYFRDCLRRVVASRERLGRALRGLGFEVFPSRANFLFARHAEAERLYSELKSAGILLRYFKSPRIDDCLRISVGSDAHCDALISALREKLAG